MCGVTVHMNIDARVAPQSPQEQPNHDYRATIPAWDRPQYPSIKATTFPYPGKGGKATLPAGSI